MLSREAPERGSSGRSALGHVDGTAVASAVARQARTPADLHLLGGRDRRRSGDLALFRGTEGVDDASLRASNDGQNPWSTAGKALTGSDRD